MSNVTTARIRVLNPRSNTGTRLDDTNFVVDDCVVFVTAVVADVGIDGVFIVIDFDIIVVISGGGGGGAFVGSVVVGVLLIFKLLLLKWVLLMLLLLLFW